MIEIKVKNPGAELTSIKFNEKKDYTTEKLFGIDKLQYCFQQLED